MESKPTTCHACGSREIDLRISPDAARRLRGISGAEARCRNCGHTEIGTCMSEASKKMGDGDGLEFFKRLFR